MVLLINDGLIEFGLAMQMSEILDCVYYQPISQL